MEAKEPAIGPAIVGARDKLVILKSLSPTSPKGAKSIKNTGANTVTNTLASRASLTYSKASDTRPCRILASSDTPDLVKKTRLKL